MKKHKQLKWIVISFLVASGLIIFNIFEVHSADIIQNKECYETLLQADEWYQQGNIEEATPLYRQCKPHFNREEKTITDIPEPVYEIEELEGGERFWNQALEGLENENQKSKAFVYLQLMTSRYPEFIPAHIKLAEFCKKEAEFCENSAKQEQPKTASEVISRVSQLYPSDPDLLKTRIELLAEEGKFLEASIAARQFSIINDDYPEAEEFGQLADDYLGQFEGKIQGELISQTVFTTLLSGGSAFLRDDPYQAISGLQMIGLMLQGESSLGETAISAFVNDKRARNQLVEDEEVINYIKGIAGKMTPYMGRDFDYEYYVVKDPNINAFALPGGKIVVNSGAIIAANSESEIAGLLGHEISHAVLSHGFLKVAKANFLNSSGQVVGSVQELQQGVPFITRMSTLINLAYSREAETQADILGTRVLASAGYAADGLRDFMAILQEEYGDESTSYLSTHPAPVDRVSYLEKLVVDNGYDPYRYMGIKRHQEIKERLRNF
ncbi:unknown [Crocosphaera subtropica ATCC 51142]|uniref:Peptidase M48 domain-containing protein n=1 Tax=Crocosphaera subtropica (strain ATCC 51142 / BH68) TaxID=43989 RepID=B1WNT8_CROS5|nr:M48 family metalloprotease [Crocosphaera subtropica]ACB51517.1 unknown [Crocosphaera subtropica ATCC 51142]